MLAKFSTTGLGGLGVILWLAYFAMQVCFIGLWVFDLLIPFGTEFLDLLSASVNGGVWNFGELIVPLLWIIGGWIVLQFIVFGIIALILLPIAKRASGL